MWYFNWDYLVQTNSPGEGDIDELKAWLRSQTKYSDTIFTRTSRSVKILRAALQLAVWEINLTLDPAIEHWVAEAHKYNVQAAVGDFFASRDVDWNGMTEEQVDVMSEGKCIDRLYAARNEVAYLVQEVGRLARYAYIEQQLEAEGIQEGRKQALTPAARKKNIPADAEMSQEL